MQTKREQVRAHNFQVRRLVRAVLLAQPEHREQPFRRSATGTLVGTIISLLILAGFAVFGMLRPATGPALKEGTNVVLEKETGTRYMVEGTTLRPVANLASALLLAGPKLQTQTLSRKRTRTLPRAEAVGIVGAPDDVPLATEVAAAGWSVCVAATTATSGLAPTTVVSFGSDDRPTTLGPNQGLLVADEDGLLYLVVSGNRYPIATAQARNALGYGATVPLRGTTTWLAALRPGRMISVLSVDGAGEAGPSTSAGPTTVGQVLAVHQGTGTQYFLVQRDRIVPVTEFEARLLIGNPELVSLYPQGRAPIVVPASAIADASRQLLPDALGWPQTPVDPHPAPGRSICVAAGPDGVPWLGTGDLTPSRAGATGAGQPEAGGTPRSGGTVLRVPPGSGVVAEQANAAGGSSGAVWLVDDTGRRYAVSSAEALGALGLETAVRVKVPSGVLAAVPRGPALDIAAARRPVAGSVTEPAPAGTAEGMTQAATH
jgi:type VII secretion protein EccB